MKFRRLPNIKQYEPFHSYRKTSTDRDLVKRLDVTVGGLFDDLQAIEPLDLNISEYNQRYLQDKLANLRTELEIDADIVGNVLCESKKHLSEVVFIEYGGGTGFLSLLSKRLGVGTVIYNDIYDVSCRDAREIASVLGCQADYYVQGDIDDLVVFCNSHEIKADGMGSFDVIEHIYDIDDFCRKLHLLSHDGTAMVHATGANVFSYPYVKKVSKKQIEIETEDRKESWGRKKGDCLFAYSKERDKIIRQYCPTLTENEIKLMVTNTRGLKQDDILRCLNRYMLYGELPKLIEHHTNTCDPYTGNWVEHLFNPYHLQETLSSNGFNAKVLPRYWGNRNNFLKNTIASILNYVIRISNNHIGLHICPYFSIYVRYNGEFSDQVHKQNMYRYRRSPLWYIVMVLWALYEAGFRAKRVDT
jgi:2-polyprenyl-3-methyl-5-hydroxy-6-metoxy-1,4-benzoquinol methylase